MARGKSRSISHNNSKRGSYISTAKPSRLLRVRLSPLPRLPSTIPSLPTWNPPQRDWRRVPPPQRRVATLSGTRAKLAPAKVLNPYSYPSSLLRAVVPEKTWICVRRKIRKEVLFAAGVGGSKSPKRNPRHTEKSKIRC